ncbi:MAG: VOC family protein [Acidimicrobiia bacterium]
MTIRRSHPVLAVHDLERSAAWYEAVFDAQRIDIDPGGWVFCVAGDVRFMLGSCPDVIPATDIGDHSYLAYLDVDDVDALHERALATGADVLKPPTDEPWGRREMAVRSPDGHRFMVANVLDT